MVLNRDTEYYSFLLRLWRVENGEQKRRAMLENVESGEKHGFTNLDELLSFLDQITSDWEDISGEGH